MDYPYGPQKSKIGRALDVAGKIYEPIPDPFDKPPPTPQEVAAAAVRMWEEYSRERGLVWRGALPEGAIAADARLAAQFGELRGLRYPLNQVDGYCEGVWQGVPFFSYTVFNHGEGGSFWPYRFVGTRLPEPVPDLVFDQALGAKRPYHLDWYPSNYEAVPGPVQPMPKADPKAGLLSRTVGRGIQRAVDKASGMTAPRLYCAPGTGSAALAARPYVREVFVRGWGARGHWLVMFEREDRYFRHDRHPIETYLDEFLAVKRFVDHP
ncbi:hypothetical protein AB0B28_02220 [Glycomyces sp. NPDC046736]|uniref:hypothetical protein n=1 Tax=Glycomyces sp. NPDC046736 TaxID=3155615 RepID=UPI0033D481B7